jgi:hypothetical protein
MANLRLMVGAVPPVRTIGPKGSGRIEKKDVTAMAASISNHQSG